MVSLEKQLNKLPPEKIVELERIVDAIIETGLAEIVILYGSYARGDFKDGKIITVGGSRDHLGSRVLRRSDYDILVVIDQPEEKREFENTYRGYTCPLPMGRTERTIREKLKGIGLPVQIIVEQMGGVSFRTSM